MATRKQMEKEQGRKHGERDREAKKDIVSSISQIWHRMAPETWEPHRVG